jgi:glutamate racemase
LLTGVISYVMGYDVTLVSSAEECAKDVYRVLTERGLLAKPRGSGATDRKQDAAAVPVHRFLTTGQPEEFGRIGQRFLGPELQSAAQFAGGGGQLSAGGGWVMGTEAVR